MNCIHASLLQRFQMLLFKSSVQALYTVLEETDNFNVSSSGLVHQQACCTELNMTSDISFQQLVIHNCPLYQSTQLYKRK